MLLQLHEITKYYGATPVLSNISLQINERERVGLVGVNGAGKSTLLQIISENLSSDSGSIYKAKETTIGYLEQNSGLASEQTIWNELLSVYTPLLQLEQELREMETQMSNLGASDDRKTGEAMMNRYAQKSELFREQGGYEIEARIRGVLHGMGFAQFPVDMEIKDLSGGEKTRLALAKLLLQQPDVLLLDEPTNHLDIATLTWLEQYLRSYPGAILVVSHDRYFLDALVGAIYEIERTSARRYVGNYSRFIQLKAAGYEQQFKQYERQQDEIARMEDFIRRNLVRASTTKRAQSRRKALEKMERVDRPQGELKRAAFSFDIERPTGKEVLEVRGLAASYTAAKPLFRHASFRIERGETIAVIGPNGVGKSTLLKTLIGQHQQDSGSYEWGAGVQIGYYDQEQGGLNPNHTVLEEVWNAYPHLEEVAIRTVLGGFLFSGEDVLKKISALSGGEKARVSLAKLMLQKANVLILDEPTNHLDLYSKEVLEAALLDYEGTLIFISHDRYFLNKIAERILELSPAGIHNYLGNYDDYLDKKQELIELSEAKAETGRETTTGANRTAGAGSATSAHAAAAGTRRQREAAEPGTGGYEAEKQAKREERNRQRRMEQLEQEIAKLEDQIEQLESQLADPAIFNDYVKVNEMSTELEQRQTTLLGCYEEWEALAQESAR